RFAFENQLSRTEQIFLEILFSFGDRPIDIVIVEEAFEQRYQYEINNGNIQRELNGFQNSLKKLLDGFLKIEIHPKTSIKSIKVVNPSIVDFLIKYIEENQNEKFNIWASAKYIEQLTARFAELWNPIVSIQNRRAEKYLTALTGNLDSLETIKENHSIAFEILDFILDIFIKRQAVNVSILNDLLNKVAVAGGKLDSWRLSDVLISLQINLFEETTSNVLDNWDKLISSIIDNISSSRDFERLQELFSEY